MTKHPQRVQEDFYRFPYHYISSLPPNFAFSRIDDWHLNYVSAVVFLLQQISLEENLVSIVDVGCGDGRFTQELAKKFPLAKIKGMDYSQKAIGLARAMNNAEQVDFEARDLLTEPVDMDFDVAVLMEVYEHIDPAHAVRFLGGVRDTLRRGGVLHMTVPHVNCPVSPHHFRHFDIETLTREVSEFFDVKEVVPFEKVTSLRRWLYRILANRYFVLNHQKTLNRIFDMYMKKWFVCSHERQCQRIYMRAVRR